MADAAHNGERPPERRFRTLVARKAERHRQAARERNRTVWFSLGLFGIVGWSVAVPTLLGIALGVWIDSHWPSRVSWTLTLLFLGIVVGCINAWHWIRQESEER
jgi:ATP synthase protein I